MFIRDVTAKDLSAILAIHNEAILNSTANWNYYATDLANRAALLAERRTKGYAFLAALEGDTLLGYASFGDFRPYDGYHRTVEHSVYIHADHHRKGIARALMLPLMAQARGIGKHVMIGALDADNAASIAFHKALGFIETGHMPQVGYKFERYLDLVLVQKEL